MTRLGLAILARAEGSGFCAVQIPGPYGSSFGVYSEIVYDGQRNLDYGDARDYGGLRGRHTN